MATVEALPQHLVALERANERRSERSAVRRRIASGEITVASVLTDPPPCVHSMTVVDLLCAQVRIGPVTTGQLLARLAISEHRQVGALTARQVALLTEHLPAPMRGGGPGRRARG